MIRNVKYTIKSRVIPESFKKIKQRLLNYWKSDEFKEHLSKLKL